MAPPENPGHEKFLFGTVFESTGEVLAAPPRLKRSYMAEEVEAIRAAAFAEGEAQALAGVAERQSQALAAIAAACLEAMPRLAGVAHEHRVGSAELALACARAIAAAALERFPHAPVQAALEALAREIEAAPRLILSADASLAQGLQVVLEETARQVGYPGSIQVRAAHGFAPNAFTLDFGDGAASFDPAAAVERVSGALNAALAAEGLHAEHLIPGGETAAPDTSTFES